MNTIATNLEAAEDGAASLMLRRREKVVLEDVAAVEMELSRKCGEGAVLVVRTTMDAEISIPLSDSLVTELWLLTCEAERRKFAS